MTHPSSLPMGTWIQASLSSPAHWTALSRLLVQQFGSTLLMATWQALFPRTEATKYPGVQVTAVPQPSLDRYIVKMVLPQGPVSPCCLECLSSPVPSLLSWASCQE